MPRAGRLALKSIVPRVHSRAVPTRTFFSGDAASRTASTSSSDSASVSETLSPVEPRTR